MTIAYLQTLRMLSRDVRLYLTSAAAYGFAFEGMRGVLLNLYLLRLGYGPRFIGLVSSAALLAFTLCCPAAGALAARLGSRLVMIAGMILITAGSGLLPLAESLPQAREEGWVLAMAALSGLGLALFLVNGIPFLMTATTPRERDHAFSAQMALVPLAAFAGSLVGGTLPGILGKAMDTSLDNPAPYRFGLLLGAALLIPAVWALIATKPRETAPVLPRETITGATATSSDASGMRRVSPWGPILLVGLVAGLRYAGQATTRTFFNVYLDDDLGASTALIGALTAGAQILAVPAALATPVLVAHWARSRVIVVGSLGQALSQSVLALVPRAGAAGLGLAGTTAMFSLTTSAFRVFSQELVVPRWRPVMSASLMMGAGLIASVMALFSGFVITALGYSNLFALGAGLTALGAGVFWLFLRERGQDSQSTTG